MSAQQLSSKLLLLSAISSLCSGAAVQKTEPIVNDATARPAGYQYGTHDCFTGPPDVCKHPLDEDKACRGKFANSKDAWRDMECDYVRYDVRAEKPTNDWLIIHAGGAGA